MGQTPPESMRASPRELLLLAMLAITFRAGVFLTVITIFPLSLEQYAFKGDGESYLLYAAALCGEEDLAELDTYHRRVFPGYPALIALLYLGGVPLAAAGLSITWCAAGLAAALAAVVFEDRRVGYATALLVPHYAINSSLVMSESVLLAFTLAGLALALRARGRAALAAAGVVFGCAGLVRPMACFAVLGAMAVLSVQAEGRRRWVGLLLVGATALGTVMAGYALLHAWSGDATEGARIYREHPGAYGGRMWALPFEALIPWALESEFGWGRRAYIWLQVAVVLAGCAIVLARLCAADRDRRDVAAGPWLVGNTIFVILIAPPWGFAHFPRFTIPAGPALFWTLRRWLPQGRRWWLLIAGALFVFAVAGVRDSP